LGGLVNKQASGGGEVRLDLIDRGRCTTGLAQQALAFHWCVIHCGVSRLRRLRIVLLLGM